MSDSASASAEEAEFEALQQAILDPNGLNSNGMGANGMASNGLNSNGLGSNGLGSNGLGSNGLGSNGAPPTVRKASFDNWFNANRPLNTSVLKYFAKCAAPASKEIVYKDTSGTIYRWPGSFGLAPNWTSTNTTPSLSEQRWVSACMMAHVNKNTASVVVSFRAVNAPGGQLGFSAAEATSHDVREMAVWGNLFSATPEKKYCHIWFNRSNGQAATVGNYATGRACGIETCGFDWIGDTDPNYIGDCQRRCVKSATNPNQSGYASCAGRAEVFTTFIPAFCGDGSCRNGETSGSCPMDCPQGSGLKF